MEDLLGWACLIVPIAGVIFGLIMAGPIRPWNNDPNGGDIGEP